MSGPAALRRHVVATLTRFVAFALLVSCRDTALTRPVVVAEATPSAGALPSLRPSAAVMPAARTGGTMPAVPPEWNASMARLGSGRLSASLSASLRRPTSARTAPIAASVSSTGLPFVRHILLENSTTGDRAAWVIGPGAQITQAVGLGNLSTAWHMAGFGDFNGDGYEDILWENTSDGTRAIWFLNGTGGVIAAVSLGVVPTQWNIAGAGDFLGTGQEDILWENTTTGDRAVWLMNGSTVTASVTIGNLDIAWHMIAADNLCGDNKDDILLENTTTGDRVLWCMDNALHVANSVLLGNLATPTWRIAGTGDIDGDGNNDILWENTVTGERVAWLLNGVAGVTAAFTLTVEVPAWRITGVLIPQTWTPVTFVSLSLGRAHTCGLTGGGTGYCWGLNDVGRLGDGSFGGVPGTVYNFVPTPIAVAGGHAFTQITSADVHSCGLATGGAAFCWGPNRTGNLGTGDTLGTATPAAVTGGIAFTVLSAGGGAGGGAYTCGLTSGGAAYCWGGNGNGQLGDGTTTNRLTPVAVAGGHGFSQLSSGEAFVCGLIPAGTAYCWGSNATGAFGNGTVVASTAPVAAGGGLIFSKITAGYSHTCGLTSAGIAYCWGTNSSGQLGNGTTVGSLVPVAVTGGLSFADLDAGGGNSTCGVTGGGAAYCWGDNTAGAVGDGTNTNHRSVPTPVSGGLLFSIVRQSRFWHACGITTSGTTYCWGYNAFGQLGNGGHSIVTQDDHDSAVPVKVAGQP